ncbi:hypothetical protein FNV43_RR26059 [Rhamnella rubrinervis]|uniref:Uncharacterized protein n=1 Tax=Rhamnella rubrinervis TaxID=2594499 RepID=A0A8K0DNK8_9ROSA|nr:hypothetical protein FNV43_RR26059 [Rhamnella rubrinervis]
MALRLLLVMAVLLFFIAQVSSDAKTEDQGTHTAEDCVTRGVACTRGQTCALKHVELAAPGANVYLQGPQATEKCAASVTPT